MMEFKFDNICLYPTDPVAAIRLLSAMGAQSWTKFEAEFTGQVFGVDSIKNTASFSETHDMSDPRVAPRVALEVLEYKSGINWLDVRGNAEPHGAAYLGASCTAKEIKRWKLFFKRRDIAVVQEMKTTDHWSNLVSVHHVIFDTRSILGLDIKFIVNP